MKAVFLDTVGLIAVWDEDDQWHAPARRAKHSFGESRGPKWNLGTRWKQPVLRRSPVHDFDEFGPAQGIQALRRDLIDAGYTHDVQGAEHDGVLPVGQRHHDGMVHDGRILRVLDRKDIAAAAPNLERSKRRLLKKRANLLKRVRTIPFRGSAASARSRGDASK